MPKLRFDFSQRRAYSMPLRDDPLHHDTYTHSTSTTIPLTAFSHALLLRVHFRFGMNKGLSWPDMLKSST